MWVVSPHTSGNSRRKEDIMAEENEAKEREIEKEFEEGKREIKRGEAEIVKGEEEIRKAEEELKELREHHNQPKEYHLYVDGVRYSWSTSSITGAQIKSLVPNVNPTYSLYEEGVGDEPDKLISDIEAVSLEGRVPRFNLVPPASFGE
jgi:hypothetical protein